MQGRAASHLRYSICLAYSHSLRSVRHLGPTGPLLSSSQSHPQQLVPFKGGRLRVLSTFSLPHNHTNSPVHKLLATLPAVEADFKNNFALFSRLFRPQTNVQSEGKTKRNSRSVRSASRRHFRSFTSAHSCSYITIISIDG
jgi:hypothetical protein